MPCLSNVGAIQVGLKVGQANMYEYMRRFGFGQKTGIPLPAESPGKVRKLSRWGSTSLASVSMGQEVSVTTLQLAQAAQGLCRNGMSEPRIARIQCSHTQNSAECIVQGTAPVQRLLENSLCRGA